MIKNTKVEAENKELSFFAPLKCFLTFGWILGVFPINFDRGLHVFQFKILRLSTLFAFVRFLLVICVVFWPILIPDELLRFHEDNNNANKSENGSVDTSDSMKLSLTTESTNQLIQLLSILGKFPYTVVWFKDLEF